MYMITNERDLKLLVFLMSRQESMTTTEIAKQFFDVKKRYAIIKKDSWLRYWLDKQSKAGIIEKINNCDKTVYTINKDNVKAGKVVFIDWLTKQLMIKDVVAIKTKNLGWIFYELPEGFYLKEDTS